MGARKPQDRAFGDSHFMQRLNIPLYRHTKTTRHHRRVVWPLVIVSIVGLFALSQVGILWFRRGEILSLAPVDTILAIQVQINKATEHDLRNWLKSIPLLSNRSIELEDVLPFTHGELAIFVTSDGTRSIAIRAKETDIPQDLLDGYSISAQQQGQFVLLSETIQPIRGVLATDLGFLVPSASSVWLGRVVLPDVEMTGNLVKTSDRLTLTMKDKKRSQTPIHPLENLSVYLTGVANDASIRALEGLLFPFIAEENGEKAVIFDKNLNVDILIQGTDGSIRTLLIFKDVELSEEAIIKQLQLIGALSRPSTISSTLPDGSLYEEMVVQPDLISVEKIVTNDGFAYRVASFGSGEVIAANRKGDLLLSTDLDLLETEQVNQQQGETYCGITNNSYIDPEFILSSYKKLSLDPTIAVFKKFMGEFSLISLEFKKYSTKLHFCRK